MRRIVPVPAHYLQQEPNHPGDTPVPTGRWQALFNGRDLEGWTAEDQPNQWTVVEGVLHCTGRGGGYLRSNRQYEHFAFACEFNIEKGANSGVFVHWSEIRDPVNTGIEIQIIDSYGKKTPDKHDCGAIYDLVAPTVNAVKPPGEWNRMVVSCQGPFISARLNGVFMGEVDLSRYTRPGRNPDGTPNKFRYAMGTLPRRGYIGLQDHGGALQFRNLLLLPLPPL